MLEERSSKRQKNILLVGGCMSPRHCQRDKWSLNSGACYLNANESFPENYPVPYITFEGSYFYSSLSCLLVQLWIRCGCLCKKGSVWESHFWDTIPSNSPNPTPVSFLLLSWPTSGGPERDLHSQGRFSPVRSLYLESSMVTLHYSSQKSFPVNFVHYHFFFARWRQLYQWPDNVGNIGHDITFWTAGWPALSKHPMGKIISARRILQRGWHIF